MRGRLLISLGLALAIAALSGAVHAVESDAESAKPRSCYAADPSAPSWTAVCIRQDTFFRDTCGAIQLFAWREQLPAGYFARLIWQESRFDPFALSTAGAQGIAQFIPSTARLRGLRNAFDPSEALAKSATYLRFLTDKFGNLGLAAAAYNSGEGRTSGYLKGVNYLPAETRFYVEIVTGRDPDAWLAEVPPDVDYAIGKDEPFIDACVKMAEAEQVPSLDRQPSEWKPWGVLLAQNFSQGVVIRRFERVQANYPKVLGSEKLMLLMARNPNFGPRLRHYAMIGRDNRAEADALCAKLLAAGGSCIVRKN
ncbi:hypothetical protein VW23_016135 [Devosia insulae DS-56]|uniref:Transglycosylase SLT domain-containing protein n=1 Tax=Devosia insulae DS-56 TaxID=1116389 RepID=A0A1E5XSE2_9HYPH|nr:lytic transglycosylase domain-containing protein [Devosia insulae]OEO31434.1 hypothetical protein VW23_016135 [Devosia insulae DS-56]